MLILNTGGSIHSLRVSQDLSLQDITYEVTEILK